MNVPRANESGGEQELTCNVFARFSERGHASVIEVDVPVPRAFEMVHELREDPAVLWAYCDDPRPSGFTVTVEDDE